jgi:hypothetical protein
VDIWALGVMAFQLYFDNFLFPPNREQFMKGLKEGILLFDGFKLLDASLEFLDFIDVCLKDKD